MDIRTFGPHALISCVFKGVLAELLCVHIVDIETFDLHALILSVSEDCFF